MLQSHQTSPPSLAQLIGQISQDAAFKKHHAANHQKGVFSLIKCTFDQMVDQLTTFSKADSFINMMQIYENLKTGAKVWAYYEYKLFAWVSLWLQLRHSITLDAIIDIDLSVLTCFFPDKPEIYLRYELFIIISRIDRFRCKWSSEEIDFFKAIVLKFLQGKRDNKRISWKYISFRLFVEKSYLKTPHQCREKWMNHLNPGLNKSKWRLTEDLKLLLAYQEIGAKWSSISKRLKNRTDHMVKNRFNSLKQKWMAKQVSEKIFKINMLVREVKQTLRIQQKREIASNPAYVRRHVEAKSDEDSYVLSSESEQQQVQEQSQKEVGCPMLSLADVGGFEIEKQVNKAKEGDCLQDALLKYESKYESLLNDPLWKNEDRIPTDEYDWLDDMIEKRNVDELDEYL